MKQYLEIGKIVNIHGIKGEVKIQPWADSPEFLCGLKTVWLDGGAIPVLSARVHGGNVLMRLQGVDGPEAAGALKGKILFADRADAALPEGRVFLEDLIGLSVRSADTGETLGTLREIIPMPARSLYSVVGEKQYLIPDAPEFIKALRPEEGYILVHLLEGMES